MIKVMGPGRGVQPPITANWIIEKLEIEATE
jgi:hypothetical protein